MRIFVFIFIVLLIFVIPFWYFGDFPYNEDRQCKHKTKVRVEENCVCEQWTSGWSCPPVPNNWDIEKIYAYCDMSEEIAKLDGSYNEGYCSKYRINKK